MTDFFLTTEGLCPICEQQVTFQSKHAWLRDHLFCSECKSIPRERALMQVIKNFFPNYQELSIHETSPGGGGTSAKLRRECTHYSESQFFPGIPPGSNHPQNHVRCENLENLTFPDEQFDLFISQDVMEHVFSPDKAFKEIARVLKKGGAHIFTVPIINKNRPTEQWARRDKNGMILHLREPEYHGNPIDPNGSLVTMHWGYDICEYIMKHSGLASTMIYLDDLEKGIRAEFIEVICTRKPC